MIQITSKGQLFHIDFGYIFGNDPKPYPPPFRYSIAKFESETLNSIYVRSTCNINFVRPRLLGLRDICSKLWGEKMGSIISYSNHIAVR